MALTDRYERFVFLDAMTLQDGYGNINTVYHPGADFEAAASVVQSGEQPVGERQALRQTWHIIAPQGVPLLHGSVIRRVRDGLTLRVTGNSTDRQSPAMASMSIQLAEAEVYRV